MHCPRVKPMTKQTLYDEIGGLPTLQKVHKHFYDKVYAHPWLKQFFAGHNQQAIEQRQTSFMAEKMGGPAHYLGKHPRMAHRQMYITNELFDLRQSLLKEALIESGLRDDLIERWLKLDNAFRRVIVKDSIADFYKSTWHYEKRVIVPKSTVLDPAPQDETNTHTDAR
jgi:hemoglobin